MALSYVRLYFYLSFFFTNITKTVRIILWSQRGLLGLIWLLFFFSLFLNGFLYWEEDSESGNVIRIRQSRMREFLVLIRSFERWRRRTMDFFRKKKAINLFFSVALPIFGMNKKCRFFFVTRCKDDCNKVFSSHYFFCVFVQVHVFWEGHKIMRNLHLTFDWHYIGQK